MTNNSRGMDPGTITHHDRIFVGIDPGLGGGVAMLYANGEVFNTSPMPTSERDVLELLRGDWFQYGGIHASIERVHAFPRMGACSAFTFGKGFGALLMALTAADIPFDVVGPKTWQQVVGVIYPKDAKQTEKKNIGKRRAQQLFPQLSVTHAIADALLIAEYTRRTAGALQPSATRGTHGEEGRTEKRKAEGAQSRQGKGQKQNDQTRERQRPENRREETAAAAQRAAAGHGARALSRA